MQQDSKSIYTRGADDGFFFGIYLSIMFILSALSLYFPIVGYFGTLMAIGVPVIIYKRLKLTYINNNGHCLFSELWLQGIITFACASIILGLVMYIFLKWIQPEFIITEVKTAIAVYNSIDGGQEIADQLQKIADNNLIPTAIQIVIETILLGTFTGSILSMILTWIIRLRPVITPQDNNSDITSL
jgi:hypothetical protein